MILFLSSQTQISQSKARGLFFSVRRVKSGYKISILLTVIPPQANQQPFVHSRRKDVKTERRSYLKDDKHSKA